MKTDRRELRVRRLTYEGSGVMTIELEDPARRPLPLWEPGAHLSLAIRAGTDRQYSLCGDPADHRTYRVAVQHRPRGRGGSDFLHRFLRPGQIVAVGGPHNHFPLVSAPGYFFLAGGIGITPMLAMSRAATHAGADWRLVYMVKDATQAPFVDEMSDDLRFEVWSSQERGRFGIDEAIAQLAPGTAVYCCGPQAMLDEVVRACEATPGVTGHIERFTAADGAIDHVDVPLDVVCARSGLRVHVDSKTSVLDALTRAGADVSGSCREGLCGTCEVRVLSGEPDHRDFVRAAHLRAAEGTMLVCVSRALSEELVIDL